MKGKEVNTKKNSFNLRNTVRRKQIIPQLDGTPGRGGRKRKSKMGNFRPLQEELVCGFMVNDGGIDLGGGRAKEAQNK